MRNSLLLLAIMLLLVVEPFFSAGASGRAVLEIIVSIILFTAIWAVSRHPGVLAAAVLLAVPAFAVRFGAYLLESHRLATLWPIFGIVLFAFTAVVLLRQVLLETAVTLETIAGSVSVYLLLAVVWALIYTLIETTRPGSFQVGGRVLDLPPDVSGGHVPEFLYFSLVTISTVGYGDIVAMTPPARMIAALEGVIGQLYLAVLVARLIGMHVPSPSRSHHDR